MRIILWSCFGLYLLSTTSSYACRCVPPEDKRAFEAASIVVIGEVLDEASVSNGNGGVAIVKMIKTWKGNVAKKLPVISLTSCRIGWKKGEHYLLFIKKEVNGLYTTDRCLGSRILLDDVDITNRLDKLSSMDNNGRDEK